MKMTGRDLLEHRTLHALGTFLAAKIDEQAARRASHPAPPLSPGEEMKNLSQTALVQSERGWDPVQPAALDALDQFQQGLLTLEDMEALLEQGEMV